MIHIVSKLTILLPLTGFLLYRKNINPLLFSFKSTPKSSRQNLPVRKKAYCPLTAPGWGGGQYAFSRCSQQPISVNPNYYRAIKQGSTLFFEFCMNQVNRSQLDHGRDMYKCAPASLQYSGNLRASSGCSQIRVRKPRRPLLRACDEF